MFAPTAAMAVADIADVAVVVVVVVVDATKDVVTVKVEATHMTPSLIRLTPRDEAVVRSAGRPGATADVVINDPATAVRRVTAFMAPLVRRQETYPVIVCVPRLTLSGTLLPFGDSPTRQSQGRGSQLWGTRRPSRRDISKCPTPKYDYLATIMLSTFSATVTSENR